MKIWAVANQKGGVGKTTTAVNLAGHLVAQGNKTLLIDLDPHGSMTAYFGYDPDELDKSVYTLFQVESSQQLRPALRDIMLGTRIEGLTLLPATTAMATLDRQLGAKEGKGLVIKRSMELLENEFDYVLIDCPPLLGILMVNALAACQHLILPVQTEFLALKGLERMLHTLEMIIKARKMQLPYTIVPTMFDRRTRAAQEALQTLRDRYGSKTFESVIPVDTLFREASKKGQPLSTMAPTSRGSMAYEVLLKSLLQAERMRHLKLVNS